MDQQSKTFRFNYSQDLRLQEQSDLIGLPPTSRMGDVNGLLDLLGN